MFARLLFGFKYDTQSGLKLFTKQVWDSISINPSPWSFDLEFIVRSLEKNYKIFSYDIPFAARQKGEAKIDVFGTAYELAKNSLAVRSRTTIKDVRSAYRYNQGLNQEDLYSPLAPRFQPTND